MHYKKNRKGFTLVEMVTVVAIVAILAAVAAPSVANFVESGRQQSRHNIARTLYVAAQNRLTELRVTNALSDRYYTLPSGAGGAVGKVVDKLVGQFPAADTANQDFVRYISKPAGEMNADHPVNLLLAPVVVDPSILNNAICIEYNIQTGVVMSVFYSDTVNLLNYSGTGNDSILGDRPYTDAAARRQGYYGVDSTGVAVPIELPDAVQIYDGATKPLTDSGTQHDNLLYAEIYLPQAATDKQRTISITDAGKNPLVALTGTDFSAMLPDTLAGALAKAGNDNTKQILYCANSPAPIGSVVQYGTDISASYDRYVWVLDYVDGDQLATGTPHSIQQKFLKGDGTTIGAQELRVGVQRTGAAKPLVSLSKAHSLYMAQTGLLGNSYTLATARHLSNIRYNSAAEFHQIQSINMKAITNFNPLPTFTGKYIAKSGSGSLRVSGLVIDTTALTTPRADVGLFEEIGSGGSVLGLSLENATITTKNATNVGAIAGVVSGRISQSNSFANVTATGKIANVGGLIGDLRMGAYLDQSYNGGYFDATARTAAPYYGSVHSDGGNVGGLVGRSAGNLQNSYNNARVNVQSVTVSDIATDPNQWLSQTPVFTALGTSLSGNFGGLVGQQTADGRMSNCYATNYVASYPAPSRSGGLVGDGAQGLTGCYYLSNGVLGADAKSKAELYTIFGTGGAYTAGAPYLQGENQAAGYPYPVLTGNPHLTGYEDILGSETVSKPVLQYYEAYQDPDKPSADYSSLLWGYRSPDGRSTLRQDLLAVTDGYCVDLDYSNSYTFKLSNGTDALTFVLTDINNNTAAPNWIWSGSGMLPGNLPLPYTADAETGALRYRLYLRNDVLEDFCLGNRPLQLTVTSRNGEVLLSQSFSPYFAMAFGTNLSNYIVRTPRQLDNIDRVAITYADQAPEVFGSSFTQQLDLDFAVYYKELLAASAATLAPDRTTPLLQKGSIVDAVFNGSYNGQHHFIRNMKLQAADEDTDQPVDNFKLNGRGLFAEVGKGGIVQQLALLRSSVEGSKRSLGGIAGVLGSGGKIVQCELSEVTVHNTGNPANYIGGVVGESKGLLQDVYFNSTNRNSTGLYATPITGSTNAGGLVGDNAGKLERCYTTAVAPNSNPIVGSGAAGSKAYYLSALGYNAFNDADNTKGTPLGPEPEKWEAAFVDAEPEIWENAKLGTTKDTDLCQGLAYLYPKLKGTNHYYDWPILSTLLKYYERYDDLSYGYYYYINQYAEVDTLRYDPDRTVIEEGYLISTLSTSNYDIRITDTGTNKVTSLTDRPGQTMDGQRVVKLLHSDVEQLSTIGFNGIHYARIQASAHIDKNGDGAVDDDNNGIVNNKDFKNELAGLTADGYVWFNPRFARAIALTDNNTTTAPTTTTLEVRSPRHLLQIEANPMLTMPSYKFNQTCSINMYAPRLKGTIVEKNLFEVFGADRFNGNLGNSAFGFTPAYLNLIFPTGNPQFKIISAGNNVTKGAAIVTVRKTIPDGSGTLTYEYKAERESGNAGSTETYTWTLTGYYDLTTTITAENTETNYYSTSQDYADDAIHLRLPLSPVSGHLISNTFSASYNGQYAGSWQGRRQSDTQRLGGYRIYNLVMNAGSNTAGMFGQIGATGKVSNLELVDAQMRFSEKGGLGGGTLANLCNGVVQNVRVWHTTPTFLFANSVGKADSAYCSADTNNSFGYRHVHGGIVGQLTGAKALISECVSGNTDNTLAQVTENNTQIRCYTFKLAGNREPDMLPIGGVVGQVDRGAVVMACTNIATVTSDLSKRSELPPSSADDQSPDYMSIMGGVVGRLGIERDAPAFATSGGHVYGSYNAGSVRTQAGWAGGVVGRANGQSSVTSCYNTGRVNVYADANGELQKTNFISHLRLGGVVGEANEGAALSGCYNIGYVSDVIGTTQFSRSGAIVGLPGFGAITMSSSYSLKANKYAPVGITGATYGKGTINGQTDLSVFATWASRAVLRTQKELLTYNAVNDDPLDYMDNTNLHPFSPSTSSFYIFPEFMGSNRHGLTIPSNRHFTPWEYIDAVYDTTLKYYEKYHDGSYGYYYLDPAGNATDTLAGSKDAADKAKLVVEDGYLLELGQAGKYDVVIGDTTFTEVEATAGLHGDASRIGILFTEQMAAACKPSYNRIRLFTRLGHESGATDQDKEDDTLNRIVGSTSSTTLEGIDLYFDYNFPKELRYGTVTTAPDGKQVGVPPVLEADHKYEIRSIRHLIGIGSLTQDAANLSAGKTFTQTRELAAASYQYRVGAPAGYTKADASDAIYPGTLVSGNFMGSYNGSNNAITGLKLAGAPDSGTVGIFAHNSGKITRMLLQKPVLSSAANNATALTMGVVAAANSGTVNLTAIYQPNVVGSATAPAQTIGGVVGVNNATGVLADINLVCAATDAVPVLDGGNPLGGTLGGMVGQNKGTVSDSIYLAVAPGSQPIVGANMDSGTVKASVWYLAGQGFNQFDPGENAGTPKATAQFTDPPNNNWGLSPLLYAYPWLTNMPQPPTPATAIAPAYTLAYYEQYETATGAPERYGWYYSEDGGTTYIDTLDKNTSDKIIAQGYAALLLDYPDTIPPTVGDAYNPAADYTVRFGSHKVVLLANKHTGLVKVTTAPAGKTYQAVLQSQTDTPVPTDSAEALQVTVNGFGMQDNNSYCNPGFAKAISSTAAGNGSYAVRNEQHLLNVGKLPASSLANAVIKQERSLDLAAHPQTTALVNTVLRGTYDGGYLSTDPNPIVIRNLNIAYAPDITDTAAMNVPVGLFRENAGTIRNVRLVDSVSVTGGNNVGGIAGINQPSGTITGCSIDITSNPPDTTKLLIKGQDNVGGITGVNWGVISNSSVSAMSKDASIGNISAATIQVGGIAGLNEESGVMNTGLSIDNLCMEGAAVSTPLMYVGVNKAADSNATCKTDWCFYKASIRIWLASEGVPFAEASLPQATDGEPVEQTLTVELPSGRRARGVSALDLLQQLETLGSSALRTLRDLLSPAGSSGFGDVLLPSGASGLSSLPDRADSGLLLAPRTIIFALDDLPVGYRLDTIEAIEPGEHYLQLARLPQLNGCIFTAEFTHTLLQFTLVSDDETLPIYQYSILLELTERTGGLPGWSGSPSVGLSAADQNPDEQR